MAKPERQSTRSRARVASVWRFRCERPGLNEMLGEDLLHTVGIDGLDVQQLQRKRANGASLRSTIWRAVS